jgi:hypothetical protein
MTPGTATKRRPYGALGAAAAGTGSALAAILAGSCCIPVVAPLIVAVLGASGAAWATGFQAYSPYLLAGSLAVLLYGLWTVYKPRPACGPEGCPTASVGRGVKAVLWAAVAIWALAVFLVVVPRI